VIVWLGVYVCAFVAEFAGDALAAHYQRAVRKLWRGKAARWAGLLALLSWVDLSGIAIGLPLTALVAGSVSGGIAGTWWAVGQQQVQARAKRKRKADRLD